MSNEPNANELSLEEFENEYFEKQKLALKQFLDGKACVDNFNWINVNQKRVTEYDESERKSNSHKVYTVDVIDIQRYLDKINDITIWFFVNVPSRYSADFAPPEADLSFLEIVGDLDYHPPYDVEIPHIIETSCSVDLSYSLCKTPLRFYVTGQSSLNVSRAHFEKSFEVQVGNDSHLKIDAKHLIADGNFSVVTQSIILKAGPHLDINAAGMLISGKFFCRDLVLDAVFVNTKFCGGAGFVNCTFLIAPDFHGADLHQDTVFNRCYFDTSTKQGADMASFRVLKSHFGKMRDSKHELMFYALEQRAERKYSDNGVIVSMVSWLYDEISEYGASIERSVKVLILWNVIFILWFHLAMVAFNQKLITIRNDALGAYPALMLTLQNTFNPLALFSEKQLVNVNHIAIYVTSLIQSLGAIIVLALMLLAIRGRFRKGGGSDN